MSAKPEVQFVQLTPEQIAGLKRTNTSTIIAGNRADQFTGALNGRWGYWWLLGKADASAPHTFRPDGRAVPGTPASYPTGKRLDVQSTKLSDGRTLLVGFFQGTSRDSSRRFRVEVEGGAALFDTGDCYDAGNALNSLEHWTADFLKAENVTILK